MGFHLVVLVVGTFLFLLSGIRIIRPTEVAAIEHLGEYRRIKKQGITWIIPFIQKSYRVNLTEKLADVPQQEIITKDNLNAKIDLQIYYKVKSTEDAIKSSLYNVFDFEQQIVALARTTMRNVIGEKTFVEVNSKRNDMNDMLKKTMQSEVESWGVEIVRVELKEILPPQDVQEAMNKVLKSEKEMDASTNLATAKEREGDGIKRSEIRKSQGIRQSKILEAEGEAKAIKIIATATAEQIKLVNEASNKYFIDNAQRLKAYEVTQASLEKNTKVVLIEKGIQPVLVLGNDMVLPVITGKKV